MDTATILGMMKSTGEGEHCWVCGSNPRQLLKDVSSSVDFYSRTFYTFGLFSVPAPPFRLAASGGVFLFENPPPDSLSQRATRLHKPEAAA
jgi:hypothetical protein